MTPQGKLAAAATAAALAAVSPSLIDFISKWEDGANAGKGGYVYADKLAGGLPTACRGITKHITTTPVIVDEWWSKEKCDKEAELALSKVRAQINRCLKPEAPQSVRDMMTSHAWNFGSGQTCGSRAMGEANRGNYEAACRALAFSLSGKPVWASVKDKYDPETRTWSYKYVQGLHNRRVDEMNYCMSGL